MAPRRPPGRLGGLLAAPDFCSMTPPSFRFPPFFWYRKGAEAPSRRFIEPASGLKISVVSQNRGNFRAWRLPDRAAAREPPPRFDAKRKGGGAGGGMGPATQIRGG